MSKLDKLIENFRSDKESERLFLEAQAEIRLSEKMTAMRLAAGYTQADLAKQLDVSQAYIAKLENGGYDNCRIGTLRSIALALGSDISFETMFIAFHRGYGATQSTPKVILHAPDHSTSSLSQNVIDFQSVLLQRDRQVAFG